MKISLNWAQHWTKVPEYTSESLEKFSHTYSTYTAEVEGIDEYIFDERIVVGKVLNWKPHPDSDKLWLVTIDSGVCGKHEIVCGAANVATSRYVPIALENAVLPSWLTIGRRAIRGVDSCGMICSLDELNLQSVRSEGIFPLETVWDEKMLEKNLWKPFGNLTLSFPCYDSVIEYAMNDVVFDLDNKFITNRPDLFSVVWNAREISCIEKSDFSGVKCSILTSKNEINVQVESDKVINYFLTEYTLPDVPVSPFLVQTILYRSNQGTHGLLPDLTNIVMTEIGQPMHVFDADTISGIITLRMAKKWEKFLGLDDKEYILTVDDLVIVDEKKILALAGIMGGKSSGTTWETRHIYVESASFDAVTIRKTSQRLGIRTDSSLRFEKGVDRWLPHTAQTRYAQLLSHFVEGTKTQKQTIVTHEQEQTIIEISHDFIVQKIGIDVSEKIIIDILGRLGFEVKTKKDIYTIAVPSWRDTGDITFPEDIVEEIARHVGYESIDAEPLPGPLSVARVQSHDVLTMRISTFFAGRWYLDVYTYPFTFAERFERFSDSKPSILQNTSENRTHLRAHMAENLLELVASNYRTHDEGAFFEFGSIFDGEEKLQGLGVLWWLSDDKLQSDLASYMMTFFGTAGSISQGEWDTKLFSPHAYAEMLDDGGEVTLRFGLVRSTLLPLFDIENTDVYAFEIVKMPILHRPVKFLPLSEFPGTCRELNFILPESTPVAVVIELVGSVHDWISDVWVSEIYRDEKHIGTDKKSVIVSFLIQNPAATITDEEAGKIQQIVIGTLAEKGFSLRGV